MLKLGLLVVALALPVQLHAATYHVAPNGADNNPGTEALPFLTWQKAINSVSPGDTILIGAGTYKVSEGQDYGGRVITHGTSENRIQLRGHGGRPVLDCGAMRNTWGLSCFDVRADWWEFSDFAVTGGKQENNGSWVVGVRVYNADNNIFQRVTTYGHEGPGFLIEGSSSENTLKNVDSHNNYDRMTVPSGGNADGIQVATQTGTGGNQIITCRAWSNSDDGFDLFYAANTVKLDGNWSFWNGYVPGTSVAAGDGVGYKLGGNAYDVPHHISRSLAFENGAIGIDSNGNGGGVVAINNTSFGNSSYGFALYEEGVYRVINNIDYGSGVYLGANAIQSNNSWSVTPELEAGDFVTLESRGSDGARQYDGSLPVLDFLRLSPGSNAIDNGANVGLPYSGSSPDLGALEYHESPTPGFALFEDDFEASFEWARSNLVDWYTGSPKNGRHAVRLRGRGSMEMAIPLTGYRDIELSFAMGASSLDNGNENGQVLYYDGGLWRVLAQIGDNTTNENGRLNPYVIALPSSVGGRPDFALRFKINGSGSGDYLYVDDVVVSGRF
jgi:hypothetical protein